MTLSAHFKLWLIIGICSLAVNLLITEARYDLIIKNEMKQIEKFFGEEVAQDIYDTSMSFMKSYFGFFIDQIKAARTFENEASSVFSMTFVLESIVKTTHILVLRFLSITVWMKWIIPFMIFLIVDAFVSRRIRSEDLTWQSPMYYHLATHGLVFTVGALFAYFLIPAPVMIWITPLFILLFIASMSLAIANFQRLT